MGCQRLHLACSYTGQTSFPCQDRLRRWTNKKRPKGKYRAMDHRMETLGSTMRQGEAVASGRQVPESWERQQIWPPRSVPLAASSSAASSTTTTVHLLRLCACRSALPPLPPLLCAPNVPSSSSLEWGKCGVCHFLICELQPAT